MSTIVEKLRDLRTSSMRSTDRKALSISRFLLGQFEQISKQPVSDEVATKIIRSYLTEAKTNPNTSFASEEIAVMESLVPELLSLEQVQEKLNGIDGAIDEIRAAESSGKATGVAMKHLKGLPVDGKTVAEFVKVLRES